MKHERSPTLFFFLSLFSSKKIFCVVRHVLFHHQMMDMMQFDWLHSCKIPQPRLCEVIYLDLYLCNISNASLVFAETGSIFSPTEKYHFCRNTCNLGDLFWREKHQIFKKGISVLALQSKRIGISSRKPFPLTAYISPLTVLPLQPPPPPVYIMHTVSLIHSETGFSHIWGNKYLYGKTCCTTHL